MKKEKLLSSIVAFLLIFTIAGCGQTEETAPTQASEAVIEETEEAQEAEEDTDGEQFVEDSQENTQEEMNGDIHEIASNFDVAGIPAYSGEPYVAVNGNIPYFADSELTDIDRKSVV